MCFNSLYIYNIFRIHSSISMVNRDLSLLWYVRQHEKYYSLYFLESNALHVSLTRDQPSNERTNELDWELDSERFIQQFLNVFIFIPLCNTKQAINLLCIYNTQRSVSIFIHNYTTVYLSANKSVYIHYNHNMHDILCKSSGQNGVKNLYYGKTRIDGA